MWSLLDVDSLLRSCRCSGHVFAKVSDEATVDRMLGPLHRPPLRFS